MPLSLRTACIIGSGVGGMMTLDDTYRRVYLEKKKRVFPLSIPRLMINAPASQISMHCGLRGPAYVSRQRLRFGHACDRRGLPDGAFGRGRLRGDRRLGGLHQLRHHARLGGDAGDGAGSMPAVLRSGARA